MKSFSFVCRSGQEGNAPDWRFYIYIYIYQQKKSFNECDKRSRLRQNSDENWCPGANRSVKSAESRTRIHAVAVSRNEKLIDGTVGVFTHLDMSIRLHTRVRTRAVFRIDFVYTLYLFCFFFFGNHFFFRFRFVFFRWMWAALDWLELIGSSLLTFDKPTMGPWLCLVFFAWCISRSVFFFFFLFFSFTLSDSSIHLHTRLRTRAAMRRLILTHLRRRAPHNKKNR